MNRTDLLVEPIMLRSNGVSEPAIRVSNIGLGDVRIDAVGFNIKNSTDKVMIIPVVHGCDSFPCLLKKGAAVTFSLAPETKETMPTSDVQESWVRTEDGDYFTGGSPFGG